MTGQVLAFHGHNDLAGAVVAGVLILLVTLVVVGIALATKPGRRR